MTRGRPFDGSKPGPGRRKGVPNKATAEIRDAARRLIDDPAYVRSLRRRLIAGKAAQMETLLHYYAYGKPKDTVDVNARTQQLAMLSDREVLVLAKEAVEVLTHQLRDAGETGL
jgi:hypothetical protein